VPEQAIARRIGKTQYGLRCGIADRLRMQDDQDRRVAKTGDDGKQTREQRLKLALRENLKRRKSQARGRNEQPSSETDDASLDDASGDRSQ
jgi:hypothetical protein